MVRFPRVLAVAALSAASLLAPAAAAVAGLPELEFVSPIPGSALVLPETNIILRPGGIVDAASVAEGSLLQLSGSTSGLHEGRLRLSDDHRTLTFQPNIPFTFGEIVTCRLGVGLTTNDRGPVPPFEFTFTVAGPVRETLRDFPIPADVDENPPPAPGGFAATSALQSAALADSLPPDFPHIRAAVHGTPTPGRLFLGNIAFGGPRLPTYLMILENDGSPFFYRKLAGVGLDFKMQPDGPLTYFDAVAGGFYALNARYAVVDSFRCGNGYSTDGHDLLLLPNGHAVLMSYDPEIVDLSLIARGGMQDATVIGLIIQELDREKNVVFQWRSWDHFQITDIVSHSLTGALVDYVHGNSIDVDPEGNFILSSRHMNEVTKISRVTGEILWRLGGKNNQFTFVNDPILFSHQHAVRRLPNGHIVLFDNGNFRLPLFSRAVEYAIDEAQKTATLVWQYRLNPDVFGAALGYVQRFSNGNTLIAWGATTPTLTEVAADGTIVSELTFDPGTATYRAFRFEWPPVKPAVVTLYPETINTETRGGWVLATIQPEAADFAVSDVEPSTVRLAGTVSADTSSVMWGVHGDGVPDLTVRFARDPLEPLLSTGTDRLEVSGSLKTGEIFRGFAEVRVVAPRGTQTALTSLRLVSTPGAIPVELTVPGAEAHAHTFAVYDVQGRLVKRWQAALGAGTRASWDGRKSDGRPVGSGIYLIRLEGGAPGPALKVVVDR